ncbi:unnamed protein product [Urochloa humidicola]
MPRSGGAGGGGRQRRSQPSASTPSVPEKHLGLGWLLPAPPTSKPPLPPSHSSVKGSSSGSISGSKTKRKTCEGGSLAGVSAGSSSTPSGSEDKVSVPSEDANQVVGTEVVVPTTQGPTPVGGASETQTQGPSTVATADIVALDDDDEPEAVETGTTKRAKKCTSELSVINLSMSSYQFVILICELQSTLLV